jgi:Tol biopolymer transport system component
VPILATSADETMPRISPDGRWLAYVSNESREPEVYVRPLRGGARTQISATGGMQPVWAPDGRRIYYIDDTVLRSAEVQAAQSSLGVVRRDSLFNVSFRGGSTAHQTYDVSPDGKQFVGIDALGADLKLKVVVNWLTEVRAKLK